MSTQERYNQELEEIRAELEILREYDREFVRGREEWKISGGFYPEDKGKDLRRGLIRKAMVKNEALKSLVSEKDPDLNRVEELVELVLLCGLDVRETDHYKKAVSLLSKSKPVKEDPPFRTPYDVEALSSIFSDLIAGGYFSEGSDLKSWLFIFGDEDQPGELLQWTRRATDPVKGYIFKKLSPQVIGKEEPRLIWGRVSRVTNVSSKSYRAGKTKAEYYTRCGGELDVIDRIFTEYKSQKR